MNVTIKKLRPSEIICFKTVRYCGPTL